MKKDAIKLRICEMSPYFLYLPVSYAIGTKCFGLLDPKEYELEEKQAWPHNMQTDHGVLKILSSGAPEYSSVGFALCDPTLLLRPEAAASFRNLRVIATIVSSSAFWAVNHNSKECNLVSDLAQFKKIIAYRAGTTSHAIAKSILKHKACADPEMEIIEVDPGCEPGKFMESDEGTLMISPSVDNLEWLLRYNRNYHVMLNIGITPEFSNLLTTALLVREEIVTEHPKMVQTLLTGIQLALDKIHEKHGEALTFAQRSTSYGDYAAHALERALLSNVIPHSIEVKKDLWLKAARNYFSSELSGIDEAEMECKMQQAVEIYKCCIEPVAKLNEDARERAKKESRSILERSGQERRWGLLPILSVGLVLGSCFTLLIVFGSQLEVIIATIIMMAGLFLQDKLNLKFWSISSLYHWVPVALFGLGGICLHGNYLPLPVSISFVIGSFFFWLNANRNKIDKSLKSESK